MVTISEPGNDRECFCEASKQLAQVRKLIHSGAPYTAILAGIIVTLNPEIKFDNFVNVVSSVSQPLQVASPLI